MRSALAALGLTALATVVACDDSPYQPNTGALVGEFSGRAGSDLETYELFLAVDQVSDSVRGLWSLSYLTSCSTHDGPFSGTLSGDRLLLRLQPDEADEATFEVSLRVLRGDSVLSGQIISVVPGASPLCFNDYAPITLYYGDVNGLPIGR
jgi:hypothetical protein